MSRLASLLAFLLLGSVLKAGTIGTEKGAYSVVHGIDETLVVSVDGEGETLTLKEAQERARTLLEGGKGVALVLAEGIYREPIQLRLEKPVPGPLVIQAQIPATVHFFGSTYYPRRGWTYNDKAKLWHRPWLHAYDASFDAVGGVPFQARHTEMVFMKDVNTHQFVRIQQHYWHRGLPKGSFYISQEPTVYLVPPEGVAMVRMEGVAWVEMSNPARHTLLDVENIENLHLRGLRFLYSPGEYEKHAAVDIRKVRDCRLEYCEAIYNNHIGLRVRDCESLNVSRSKFNHNGFKGVVLEDVARAHFSSVKVNLNYWRGFESGLPHQAHTDRSAFVLRDVPEFVLEYSSVTENRGNGLASFGPARDYAFRDVFVTQNNGRGLYVEYVRKLSLRDSRVLYNIGPGLDACGHLDLHGNIFFRNGIEGFTGGAAQIAMPGTVGSLKMRECTLVGDQEGVPLMLVRRGQGAHPDFDSEDNIYYHWTRKLPFAYYGSDVDFQQWAELTGSDQFSLVADPRFADPGEYNYVDDSYVFLYESDSPLYNKSDWPVLRLEKSREEAFRDYLEPLPENP